jgi:hypothetical protein
MLDYNKNVRFHRGDLSAKQLPLVNLIENDPSTWDNWKISGRNVPFRNPSPCKGFSAPRSGVKDNLRSTNKLVVVLRLLPLKDFRSAATDITPSLPSTPSTPPSWCRRLLSSVRSFATSVVFDSQKVSIWRIMEDSVAHQHSSATVAIIQSGRRVLFCTPKICYSVSDTGTSSLVTRIYCLSLVISWHVPKCH